MVEAGALDLDAAQVDRVAGVLLAQACGDALGVPYEFAALPPVDLSPQMLGGGLGPYAPGEYSDDTQMAVCIAKVAATGADLTADHALDEVAERFLQWLGGGASDVGAQTRAVLTRAQRGTGRPAVRLRDEAAKLHARTGKSAGNGALMRTAPVALAHLGEPEVMAAAARAVAELTHADPLAGDACVLWCAGIVGAITHGSFDGVRGGLDLLPARNRDKWAQWLSEAEHSPATQFNPNGFTVPALQAAYAAVWSTPVPPDDPADSRFPCLHLQHALAAAVRVGDDTDTVAAIAGAVLGARWGVSAIPFTWRRIVHGWPDLRSRDLVRLAVLAARNGESDQHGWPDVARMHYGVRPQPAVAHPYDDGVLLGGAAVTGSDADAVVSLCRLGRDEVPAPGVEIGDHVESWLIDSPDLAANANLEFVIDDAARAVAALRNEGRRVLLHCVQAQSRTPTVAARYAALRGAPVAEALDRVVATLPDAQPIERLRNAVRRLGDGRPRHNKSEQLPRESDPWLPASRNRIAISWWLASELVRRHPELTLIETHPGGGLYDCLSLYRRKENGWQDVIQLNRVGSAHITGPTGERERWSGVWEQHLVDDDPHEVMRRLEHLAGLPWSSRAPHTGPGALVYRLIARVLAMHVDDKARWDCRNEMVDSSGGESGPRGYIDRFPAARDRRSEHTDQDVLGNPSYRFWTLLRDDEPVALFETVGAAFVGDQRYDLMELYRADRRLFPVIANVLGDVLP